MQKLITCLTVVILTLLLSCQRGADEQGGITPNDKLIATAQQYFNQQLTKPVDPAIKPLGPMAWYQRKQPQWGQANTFDVDGKSVVETPLLVDGQSPLYTMETPAFGDKGTIKTKNGVTKALFFQHKDGTLQAYVLKLIADEEYYAANSTTYQNLSLNTLKNGYSGFVLMTDWNDQILDSYRMEKGKVVAATRSDLANSPNARSMASCQPICQNVCISLSMPCCSMHSDPNDYCCRNVYTSCAPQCYYLCFPDPPIVEPIHATPTPSVSTADYNMFVIDSDYLSDDPSRPHINVTINNKCQGEALRQLINNAAVAQTEYNAAMGQCLIDGGFITAGVDIANQGGFFKMIMRQMKNAGGKGTAGYRSAMVSLGWGALAAAYCTNNAYKVLQTKYTQYESDFKVAYNQPCN